MKVTVTVRDLDYTATLENGSVTISRDGIWAGKGRWNGVAIEDCAADLGEEVYQAIEVALATPGMATTYPEYWRALFGDRDADAVVAEFNLTTAGLDEWAGSCEEAAGVPSRREFAERVRRDLRLAAVGAQVTDADIEALRTQAGETSDAVMMVVCDVALDDVQVDPDCLDEDGLPDYSGGGHSAEDLAAIRRWLRTDQAAARAECVRVIAAFRAED